MADDTKRKYWVGFDLGGTKMMSIVFDNDLHILARDRKKTKGHEGVQAGMSRICDLIRETLQQAGIKSDELQGIGVGSPGPLDLNRGVILDTPNLGWKEAPLRKTLENAFGCPAAVINDVDAGVYGEYRAGGAKGARCVVGIFPGTGIGGGCVYDGQLIRGKTLSAFEIGHIPLMPDGPLCGCGNRGCLEAIASRLAISAAAAAAAYRGDAPHLMEEAGTDLREIRSGMLARAIEEGDDAIKRIVADAARWIGRGLACAVNLMAPDVVLLGGGLVEAMPKLFEKEVSRGLEDGVMAPFRGQYDLRLAKLGDDAGATGAAAWAQDSCKGEKGK
ncbi:MAG: ROK family protein [Lentisphaerae bacterium]|nr:ROK family protein [Lentisphaerota bacterium]